MQTALSYITQKLLAEFGFKEDEEDVNTQLEKLKVPINKDEVLRLSIRMILYQQAIFRLLKVKELGMLDSNDSDAAFDRLSSLGARIFKTPICLISIVDVNRVWFKSRVGVSFCEVHRDLSFCSYTVAGKDTEPLIICDTLQSEITVNHPLVTNEPYVRFYAGANIIIDNFNVGTFCVMDFSPRDEFDENSVKSLLDITGIITDLFVCYRQNHLDRELEAAKMSVRVLFNLKYPLSTLNSLKDELYRLVEKDNLKINKSDVEHIVLQMKKNMKILESTIDTNLSVIKAKYGSENNSIKDKPSNFNNIQFGFSKNSLFHDLTTSFETIKTFATLYNNNSNISWQLEEKYTFETYSSLLTTVMYTSIIHYIKFWSKIDVKFFFQKLENPKSKKLMVKRVNTANTSNLFSLKMEDLVNDIIDDIGFLVVNIHCYHSMSEPDLLLTSSPVTTTTSENIDPRVRRSSLITKSNLIRRKTIDDSEMLQANNDLLSLISGGCKLHFSDGLDDFSFRYSKEDSNRPDKTLLLWMPCKVTAKTKLSSDNS